ncbi:MAG: hypothetical protein NUW01_01370 [Gemmatimonadaceae bacterium]|nr:hypothetical protein [Gemmatimonadaceae bacterium]
MSQENEKFAAPEVKETPAEKIARLREKAELQAAQEFNEDAVYAKLLADAREKQAAELARPKIDLPTDSSGFAKVYDFVEIFESQDPQERPFVPLSIGGFAIRVPRGKKVVLPHAFVEDCLALAFEARLVKLPSGGYTLRPNHRFPYRVYGSATEDEYLKFMAEQREQEARETARVA